MKEICLQCLPETTTFISANSIPANNNTNLHNTSPQIYSHCDQHIVLFFTPFLASHWLEQSFHPVGRMWSSRLSKASVSEFTASSHNNDNYPHHLLFCRSSSPLDTECCKRFWNASGFHPLLKLVWFMVITAGR